MIQRQGLLVFGKLILTDINLTVGLEIVKLNSTSIFPAIRYVVQVLLYSLYLQLDLRPSGKILMQIKLYGDLSVSGKDIQ